MKNKRNLSSNLFIAIGTILIIAAIIGIFPRKVTANTENIDVDLMYADFPDQLPSIAQAAPVVIPDSSSVSSVEQSTAVVKSPLDTARYSIHVPGRADLESPAIPVRIEIPKIALDAPVITADYATTEVQGQTFGQWKPPGFFASAWHPDSALLGEVGNTVLNGHHNVDGEVFKGLVELEVGDTIFVYSEEKKYEFVIVNRLILEDTFMDAKIRLANARWLARSEDVRLTLVTCWPLTSYTHRLILVASPVPSN
jgi:LPXTG-site transpeptidase (sortase) family protein